MRRSIAAALFAALAMLGQAPHDPAAADSANRLTADEVRGTFVGREWSQGTGTFLFSKDGKYSYSDNRMSASGTYEIADDGVLCTTNAGSGVRTCYTFYRHGNGYRYWHDRSRSYWPVHLR